MALCPMALCPMTLCPVALCLRKRHRPAAPGALLSCRPSALLRRALSVVAAKPAAVRYDLLRSHVQREVLRRLLCRQPIADDSHRAAATSARADITVDILRVHQLREISNAQQLGRREGRSSGPPSE